MFLVLLTNKLDQTVKISFFAATSPLFLTFFTLIITSFGTRGERDMKYDFLLFQNVISGGNQYWFGLRKPPCQFLFSVCPCLQLFGESHDWCIPELESIDVLSPGNVSYSLYTHGSNNNNNNRETHRMTDTEIVDIYPSELVFFNSIT